MREHQKQEKGQGLVEFALVAPLLLALVIGIAEFGRAWMTRNILTGAAREAVRIAAVNSDVTVAQARANGILSSASLTGATVTVNVGSDAYGAVTATVTYDFVPVVGGFIGLDNITLTSTTTMRREY